MPWPYAASPGIVTGRRPRIGISPKSALTAAVSDGGTVLNVAMYAVTAGKLRSRYGFPSATSASGLPFAASVSTACGKSPASATVPRFAPTDAKAATTYVSQAGSFATASSIC
jgi:hypothetical protein